MLTLWIQVIVYGAWAVHTTRRVYKRSNIETGNIKAIKKGYLSQTANLFVNLKSNTMKNTLQIYGHFRNLQIIRGLQPDL